MTTELGGHPDTSSSASPPITSAPAAREPAFFSSTVPPLHRSSIKIHPPPSGSGEMPPPATIPKKRKAPDAPARVQYISQSSASSSAASGDDEAEDGQDDGEYAPASATKRATATADSAAISKRTRVQSNAVAGPSNTSALGRQMATAFSSDPPTSGKVRQLSREQLRKANHSLIEKRRREKINAALQALRDMVPSLGGPDTSGKAGEFKLEVLERTVEHMRELKEYISTLEKQLAAASPRHPKRQAAQSRQAAPVGRHDVTATKSKHRQSTSSPPTPSSSPDTASDSANDEDEDEVGDGGSAGDRSHHQARIPDHVGRMRGGAMEDPDETEPEAFLPPAGTVARRRRQSRSDRDSPSDSTTSTGSLLPPLASHTSVPPFFTAGFAQSAHDSAAAPASGSRGYAARSVRQDSPSLTYPASLAAQAVPSTRPAAPPQAHNPTLYLPFPTPSPTSPFLTYSTTASTSSGPPEPSPFLAPLQNINMSLFGGAINLDQPIGGAAIHGSDTPTIMGKRSYSDETRRSDGVDTKADADIHCGADSKRRSKQHMAPEEVANLLLAISSPDTLRPSNGQTMLTPKMIPIGGPEDLASLAGSAVVRENMKRRSTLESEELRLDAVPPARPTESLVHRSGGSVASLAALQGKTASDILELSRST